MSGGPRSRFPRTTSSVSADRLTIEREKIRHRRPDDMRVHEPDGVPDTTASEPSFWPEEEAHDDARSPWTDDNEEWPDQKEPSSSEAQGWDEGGDDEWVFDDPAAGDHAASDRQDGGALDDGGVVWEDANDIQMRAPNFRRERDDEVSLGPEVELAGRRDVRPRPPKRPRPPQARRQTPIDDGQPPAQPEALFGPVGDEVAPERSPPPARQTNPPQNQSRFARTQATIEIAPDGPSSMSRMPPPLPGGNRPPSRRRQPHQATPIPSVKPQGRQRSRVTMIGLAALIGVGGWFAYQSLNQQDGGSLIEQLGDTLGVSESGRTASDTPFGSSSSTDNLTNAQPKPTTTEFLPSTTDTNSQTGGPLSLPSDSATATTDGPPLPQFKPRNDAAGVTGSGSTASSVQVQQLDEPVAATPAEEEEGPSVMQKIWGNLISN